MDSNKGKGQSIKEPMRKIMPTNYFIALLILLTILHFTFPVVKILHTPSSYLGWALILFGAVMNLWTDKLFKQHATTVKPHLKPSTLITSGPFSVSRHPMYLGMAAVLLGVAVIHGTISGFISPVIYVVIMDMLFISVEEKNLRDVFGARYADYVRKVRRWI